MEVCTQPYISPLPIYARIRLDRFTGRAWLAAELDACIREDDRGYIVLEAPPGTGKTSFLANLVHQRGYIHLFVEQARGLDNLANGLRTLAAQVIRVWKLQSWMADDLLPGIAVRPDFLHNIIYVAARRRDQIQPGEPIVLVIDGLEDAGQLPGQNVMGLPAMLPKGVYVIVSQRSPVSPVELHTDTPVRHLSLAYDDPRNLHDMHDMLVRETAREPLVTRLYAESCTPEQVVETVQQACQGNWSYLFHVLEAIEQGNLSGAPDLTTFLDTLPDTPCAFYARSWGHQKQQAGTAWARLHLPLITTLCALMEGVSASLLCVLAGVRVSPDAVQHLLETHWHHIITVSNGGELHYTLGDSAMRDFFSGCIHRDTLDTEARTLADELVAATRQAHSRVASFYLDGWGGLDRGLPRLVGSLAKNIVVPPTADMPGGILEQGYGMRHMVAHMEQGTHHADVHRLFRIEQVEPQYESDTIRKLFGWIDHLRNWLSGAPLVTAHHTLVWHAAREQEGDLSDFLCDVAQAWYLADQQGADLLLADATGNTRPDALAPILGDQCRYALIVASLNSLGASVPLPLLVALLEHHIWSATQVLVYVREMANDADQATALAAIGPFLAESMMGNALAIVRAIGDEQERARAIGGLAPHIPDTLQHDLISAARAISYPAWRATALMGIVPHLDEPQRQAVCEEALDVTRTIWHAHAQVKVLVGLAPCLPEPLLAEAVKIARTIIDAAWRTEALVGIAPYLPRPLLRDALSMWEVWGASWRARVIAHLSPQLHELGQIDRALAMVPGIKNPHDQAAALAGLAPYLSEPMLNDALNLARSIADEPARVAAIAGLAPSLPRILVRLSLDTVRELDDAESRVIGLCALLPCLPESEHSGLIDEIAAGVQAIEQREQQRHALCSLTPELAKQGYIQETLTITGTLDDRQEQTQVMAYLAPYLPDALLLQVLNDVEDLQDQQEKSLALAKLAPSLPDTLLRRALDAARAIGDSGVQVQVLAALAGSLPETMLNKVLTFCRTVNDEHELATALAALAPHLPDALLRDALHIARTLERGDARRHALTGLAATRRLSQAQLASVLEHIGTIDHEHDRALALAEVAPVLPESLLATAFDIAHTLCAGGEHATALVALIPHLPPSLSHNVIADVQRIERTDQRETVMAVMYPWLARHGRWRQAFDETWGIGKTVVRVTTLVQLVPFVPPVLHKDILAALRLVEQPEVRAAGLADMLPHLPPEERPYILEEILKAALAAGWRGAATPVQLVPRLSLDTAGLEKVLLSVQMIDRPVERVEKLIEVHTLVPEPLKGRALHHALSAVRLIWREHRAAALARLAPHLPIPLLRDALREAHALERESWQITALAGIAPHLPEAEQATVLHELVQAIRTNWQDVASVRTLLPLVPSLPEAEQAAVLTDALQRTSTHNDPARRREGLSLLAPHLATLPPGTLYPLWCNTLHMLASRTRRDLLADIQALLPVLLALGGRQAVSAAANALQEAGRWFG